MEDKNQENINNNERRLLIPKIDVVFHSLFRVHNEELTSKFVSSLLQSKVKILNMDKDRHLIKQYPDEKLGILDLRTELEGGTLCNIEIQLADKGDIIDRILYYWSRAFSEQLKEGNEYQELHKTIGILITDFEIQEMKEIEELGKRWVIMLDDDKKRILTEKLEFHIIEIPKAKRILEKDPKNEIAQWMMFLDNPNSMEVSKIMSENKEIKEAVEELEEMSKDEELRRLAFLKEKYIRDEKSAQRYYRETGLEEGRKEGREIGLKEGREEGIKEGRREEKAEIIQKMIDKGMKKEEVCKLLDISIDGLKEYIDNK